ncbi:hypothetical protein ES703_45561 [subsurface metagenome]
MSVVPKEDVGPRAIPDEIVATLIRLPRGDKDKIQKIYPRGMSGFFRQYAHDFLKVNGFKEKDLMVQDEELAQAERGIKAKRLTIQKQLGLILAENVEQYEEMKSRERTDFIVKKMIYDMAETLHTQRYGDQYLAKPKRHTRSGDIAWIKSLTSELKNVPGFDKSPNELLTEMEMIIERNQEKWEAQLQGAVLKK